MVTDILPSKKPPRTRHTDTPASFIVRTIHSIIVRLEIRLDREKDKPTKVAPYVRFRNGKKELVKGYVRKNREV